MTAILIRKLLRDIWVPLVVVALLVCAFQLLWAHVTRRITTELIPEFTGYVLEYRKQSLPLSFLPPEFLKQESKRVAKDLQGLFFQGPGKIVQSLIGGETISLDDPRSLMSVGYVHPLVQVILCIWAIGRASGAIAGEIDRGTMELLLAQPVPRGLLVFAHLCVDAIVIPILCLSLWSGTWLGTWLTGFLTHTDPASRVDPWAFAPALPAVALLLFAVSGSTMAFSAFGRFRGRVMGLATLITLVQFLINLIGQLWDVAEPLRPFMLFHYYQPQLAILNATWSTSQVYWINSLVLLGVGAAGYLLAAWRFAYRDLPAPL